MCGRFALHSSLSRLAAFAGMPDGNYGGFVPRYNIAPGQVILNLQARFGEPSFETYWWGFHPARAGDDFRSAPINARSETVAANRVFKDAFASRRSIVFADGFYEWRSEGGRKQPYYIRRRDGEPLALAGIFERREAASEPGSTSCAIITTAANEMIRPIHDRMPVIIPRKAIKPWMSPELEVEKALALLRPAPDGLLEAYPVSLAVNRPDTNGPELIEPAEG